jgi:hypothetical protein
MMYRGFPYTWRFRALMGASEDRSDLADVGSDADGVGRAIVGVNNRDGMW